MGLWILGTQATNALEGLNRPVELARFAKPPREHQRVLAVSRKLRAQCPVLQHRARDQRRDGYCRGQEGPDGGEEDRARSAGACRYH